MFCKKDVLGNFTKFTGKHLCQSLFFNKVAGLRSETLLKKRLWQRCFPVNFAKFVRRTFLTERVGWLLLILEMIREIFHSKQNLLLPLRSRTQLWKIFQQIRRKIFKNIHSNKLISQVLCYEVFIVFVVFC